MNNGQNYGGDGNYGQNYNNNTPSYSNTTDQTTWYNSQYTVHKTLIIQEMDSAFLIFLNRVFLLLIQIMMVKLL